MPRHPPSSTLCPYTTLFRSEPALTPLDPGRVTPAPAWSLRAPAAGGASWALVGGVVGGDLRVELTASIPAEGAAVLLGFRSEEHTSELQSQSKLVCRLLLEK